MPVHYTTLRDKHPGTDLKDLTCTFNKLSPDLQVIARADVQQVDLDFHRASISLFKNTPVHSRINSRNGYHGMVRKSRHIARTHSDVNYLDTYIISNFCQFDKVTGAYIVYSLDQYK